MAIKHVLYTSYAVSAIGLMKTAQQRKMKEAVNELRNKTLQVLRGTRTSKKKRRVPGTQRWYTPSRPGEPPAVATGRMKGSIRGRVVGSFPIIEGQVGTELEYPGILEKKMDRKWLSVAVKMAQMNIRRILGVRWF